MNSKKEEELRGIIRSELRDLVMHEIEVEKGPRKQGDPEGKRVVKENWNVLAYMAGYIPYLEGALRGMQEDVDSSRNNSVKALEAVKAMAGILEVTHKSMVAIAGFASRLEHLQLPDLETEVVRIIQDNIANSGRIPLVIKNISNTGIEVSKDDAIDGEAKEIKDESSS